MALSHVPEIVSGLAAVVVVAGVVVGGNVVVPSIGGHGQVAKSGWVGPLHKVVLSPSTIKETVSLDEFFLEGQYN
jgi:hypothetical protein